MALDDPTKGSWNKSNKYGIDLRTGIQPSEIYTSAEVFDDEMEKIFGKCWLLVGHESQIPQKGDFVVSKMGNDSVIVSRHRDDTVHVLLNQCRHRGVKLLRTDYGSKPAFICSYHGWCYGTDGKLLGMPHVSHHRDCFKKSEWGLVAVPKVEIYRGLIFANWDESAEPLADYLAESMWYLDAFFDRSPAGSEFIGLQKWVLKANWKWGAEQHASDFYHAQVSHVSYTDVFFPEASTNRLIQFGPPEYGLQYSSPERGHGGGWLTIPHEILLHRGIKTMTDDVVDYWEETGFPKTAERLGDTRSNKMTVFHMNIFPHMSLNRGQGYLRLWQPISPTETEVWSFVFVDADLPEELKASYLTAKANIFSAAGGLEQDDAENTTACQMGVTGTKASKTKLNIMMGDVKEPPEDFEGPGLISDEYSEVALRGFYHRWASLMDGEG